MNQVKFCNAPAFDEIGVKSLYEKVVSGPGMGKYFPDKYPKGRQCDKTYMYNIWNTVHPDEVQAVIEHANGQRYSLTADKVKEDTILMTDKWRQELEAMPFTSKQKGRMSHLLKQKSKVGVAQKPRAQYDPFDFTSVRKQPRDRSAQSKEESKMPGDQEM